MINEIKAFFQYKGRDLVYIIPPLTSQLCTASCKVTIKYVGPVVIYKILDPHNYLFITLDGRILRGLLEHEIKTCEHKNESRNHSHFSSIKANYECRFKISLGSKGQLTYHLITTNIIFKL